MTGNWLGFRDYYPLNPEGISDSWQRIGLKAAWNQFVGPPWTNTRMVRGLNNRYQDDANYKLQGGGNAATDFVGTPSSLGGYALRGTGTSGASSSLYATTNCGVTSFPVSLTAWLYSPLGNVGVGGITNTLDSSARHEVRIWCSSAPAVRGYAYYNGTGVLPQTQNLSTATMAQPMFVALVCVSTGTNTIKVYCNGTHITGSNSSALNFDPMSQTSNTHISSYWNQAGSNWQGGLYRGNWITDFRVYNRVLTEPEINALADPKTAWELYWTPTTTSYLFLGTAVSVTADMGVGSATVAGAAATRLVNVFRLPTEGAVTVAGSAASRLVDHRGQPAAGVVTTTGEAPARREAMLRVPDTGSVTTTGLSALLFLDYKVQPAVGTATFEGQAPTALSSILAQYARPILDVADGSWLPSVPAADLYDMVDEVSASDTDYIYSDATPADDTAVLQLTSLTTPATGTSTLRVRAKWTS